MAKASFRKYIRINGKLISKRFYSKAKAEQWYHSKYHEKTFSQSNVASIIDSDVRLNDFFDNEWLPKRKKEHPASTWMSDEQRYRDYVREFIGFRKMTEINQNQVRSLLVKMTDQDGLSAKTRNRVRALISGIFNDAINRAEPLASSNPTFGLRFKGKRVGSHSPSHLKDKESCLKFLKTAKQMGPRYLLYAATMLMSGLRKQEFTALRIGSIELDHNMIKVCEKYIQAEKRIVTGTKRGTKVFREVPIPNELVTIIRAHLDSLEAYGDDDLLFPGENGQPINPRTVYDLHMRICELAGLEVTVHGLRHSFGREFAANSKNLRALQDILGHSSYTTTQLYSELGRERLVPFQETVTFFTTSDADNE